MDPAAEFGQDLCSVHTDRLQHAASPAWGKLRHGSPADVWLLRDFKWHAGWEQATSPSDLAAFFQGPHLSFVYSLCSLWFSHL